MRYAAIVLLLGIAQLHALTPIANDYSDKNQVYQELRNIIDNAQDRSFTTVNSTPNPIDSEIRDREIVIYYSSATVATNDVRLMLRLGTTIYSSPQFTVIKGR